MTSEHDTTTVDDYEDFDDNEGAYDVLRCAKCGKYLSDTLSMQFCGRQVPDVCPRCGRRVMDADGWNEVYA